MKPRRFALYALALLLPLAMLALRQTLPVSFGERPLLILFMFPIIISALLGGLGPGLLATAAVGGLTAYFLVPPVGSFAFATGHDLAQWGMLLANGVLVSLMSHILFRARSQQIAALEARQRSEAGFRAIFEQAAVGIARVAPDGRFLQANDKFSAILGYSEAELLARTFMDITHPDDLPADLEQVRRLHAGEIPSFTREKRFIRKDGATLWARIHITAVRKPDGAPDYRIGVIEDINREKADQQLLIQEKAFVDSLIDTARTIILVLDRDGRILRFNHYLTQLTGHALEEVQGREWFETFLPERDRARIRALFATALSDHPTRGNINAILTRDGREIEIEWFDTTLKDAEGQIIGLLTTGQDVTQRRLTEQRLQAALAEQTTARRAALNLMEDAQSAKAEVEATLAALRESEGRFRALVEQSLAGIYIIQDGCFRYVNPGFAAMFGYASADEIIGRVPVAELVMPDDRARVAENVRQRVDGEISDIHYTFAGLRRDGGRIEVEVHGRRFDYQGRPAVIGLILDITARKAAEDALRESELRFHDIVDASADWVWEVDAQGRYTYASESVRDLLGYGPEELLGKTPFDLMPPDEAARVAAEFAAIAAECKPFRDLENTNLRKDGRQVHVASNGMPILGADGQLLGYRGLDRDITERRLADIKLAEREARHRAVIESTPDGFWMVDVQGRIQVANDAYARLSGYSLEELQGMPIADVEIQETQDEVRVHMARIMREGSAVFESRHCAKDGHIWPVEVAVSYWPQGGYMFAFLRDISARKAAEAALRESEASYRQLFESSQDAMCTLGAPDWRLRDVNRAAVRMFKADSAEQLLALGPWDISPERQPDGRSSAEAARERIKQAMEEGAAFFEWQHRRLDGEPFAADVLLTRVEQRGETQLQATVRDITDRKAAETAMAGLNQRLRTLIDTIPDLVWLKDVDGVFLACNTRFEALFGVPEAEIVGKTDYDFVPRELADFFRASDRDAMEAGRPILEGETEIVFASDGHRETVQALKAPFHDGTGKLIGVLGIARDITAIKASEAALRARERYIRALFDNFPFMVWLKDRDSRFLAANKQLAKVAGASSVEEVLGKTDLDFWPPDMAEHFRADDRAVLASGRPKTVEEEITDLDHRFWLETFKSPVELDGEVIGTVGFARDISERRAAEAELKARNDELERFNRATVGRELDVLEMKKTINALSQALGREAPYPLAFLNDGEGEAQP